MPVKIHPLAVVDAKAELEADVSVGPFCFIGAAVRIGRGTRLISHVTILGHTVIGRDNLFYPGVVIGADPQDLTYDGTATRVKIGDGNVFRESVTVNKATTKEDGLTAIGNSNYFMACCHVAHDCKIANHVLMANGVLLGGHTHIHDWATLSGNAAVHHFTTVGSYSFVGGQSRIVHDVPPYMLVDGNPSSVRCVNIVGLKRRGFSAQEIAALSEAYRLLYRAHLTPAQARETLRSHNHLNEHVEHLLQFVTRQRLGLNGRQRQPNRLAQSEAA